MKSRIFVALGFSILLIGLVLLSPLIIGLGAFCMVHAPKQ